MPSCCSCVAKKSADDSPYRPKQQADSDKAALTGNSLPEDTETPTYSEICALKSGNIVFTYDNKIEELESHTEPLIHTEVKTTKNGNTVTTVRTTHTREVVNSKHASVHIEPDTDSGNYDRVYQTTVTKNLPTKNKRRFNLKSVLVRSSKSQSKPLIQDNDLQRRCLDAHNGYRAVHGLKPLILSKELCEYATEWANDLAKQNKLQHRKKNKYGENLAMGTGAIYTPEDAVKSWYDEIENYDFQQPGFSSQTGHFSQVVWKESSELGVGVAQRDNSTWIVCNYDPPGNIMGQYIDNVVVPKVKQNIDMKRQSADSKVHMKAANEQDETKPGTSQTFKKIENNKYQKWSKFELDCLEAHNKLRALHGCAPLSLDKALCNTASDWATHLTKIRTMYHRPQNEYGENIYQAINNEASAEDAVQTWYDEIKNYKFNKPGFSSGTGHFTQIVWLNSTELGVGKAKVDNITFIVCNYNPPGNVLNHYKTQVPPLGGFPNTMNGVKKETNDESTAHDNEVLPTKKKSNFFKSNWFKSKQDK